MNASAHHVLWLGRTDQLIASSLGSPVASRAFGAGLAHCIDIHHTPTMVVAIPPPNMKSTPRRLLTDRPPMRHESSAIPTTAADDGRERVPLW
jgi:hypothetical protein